jgi:hypothetical protein
VKVLMHVCSKHGRKRFTFRTPATYEQRWIGDVYECPAITDGHRCQSSVLIPSAELLAFWASLAQPSLPVLFLEGR